MFEAAESPYLVPYDGTFRVRGAPTAPPPDSPGEDELEARLADSAVYEDALGATSRSWAPWYAIPADDKDYMRMTVADLLVRNLQQLDLAYPEPSAETLADLERGRRALEAES